MKQQVQHMVRLVDDLLDVSRIMRGKIQLRKERVPLADVIARGVETARPLIDAAEARTGRLAPQGAGLAGGRPGPHRPGHRQPAEQRGQVQRQAGPHPALPPVGKGDEVVLRVLDDGIGIDKDLLPPGLRPVHPGRPQRGPLAGRAGHRPDPGPQPGAAARRQRRGAERRAGQGERVRRPPARRWRRPTGRRWKTTGGRPPPRSPPRRSRDGCSIVDDNVDAARAFAEIASLWKHDVRVASNGAAALELAKSYHPDVVLLDIGLPGMSGYQVARQLRREPEFAKTLLVAVTGYGQEEDRRRSREAGFNHHLVKPVAPDELHDLLTGADAAVSEPPG